METGRSQVKKRNHEVEASSSGHCAVKKSHAFKGYPHYSNIADDDLKSYLHGCGLDQLYSCLEWRWTPFDFIVDFVGHAQIQDKPRFEDTILRYFPHGSGTPVVFTMHKVAETFNLDLQGFCVEKAVAKEVNMGDRFQIQKTQTGECYFPVTSAATNALNILARFVIQAIFLSQNTMKGTIISMRHLQLALSGTRVAWGKLLWKYLVKRLQSCQQQDGATDFYSKLKSSHAGLAAVIGALLLRVEIDDVPEHEAWYNCLLGTLPDCDSSETVSVEIMQADGLPVQTTPDGDGRKRRRCCGASGCRSAGPYEDSFSQLEHGSETDVEVVIDDDEDELSNFAALPPGSVDPEANGERLALVVYQSPKDNDARGADDIGEADRKSARSGISKEVYDVDMSFLGDGGVPLIKWEEKSDSVIDSSNVTQNCREKKDTSNIKEPIELSAPGESECTGKVEDINGQELLEQFTKMVNDWSCEKTFTEEEVVNHNETDSMSARRDIFESISSANRTLESTLKLMEETMQLKSNSIQEKVSALRNLIKERSELTNVVGQENRGEETQEVSRDGANQRYYEKVVTADLSFDIMNFKREVKVMNLYLHVNVIKLEQREVEVKSMMDGIRILLESLHSLEEKLLQDSLYQEIRQLLNVKNFMLKKLVEDIRNLNEGLKLWQEKLGNEVELLELQEEEIKSSKYN